MRTTGIGWLDLAITIAAGVTAILIALAMVHQHIIKPTVELRDRVMDFMDDWSGRPSSHGRPRTPGVIERLDRLEGQLSEHIEQTASGSEHEK